jgi:hypothetical protein
MSRNIDLYVWHRATVDTHFKCGFVNEVAAFLPSTTNNPKSEENTCQSDRLELLVMESDKPQLTMEGAGTISGAIRLCSDDEEH